METFEKYTIELATNLLDVVNDDHVVHHLLEERCWASIEVPADSLQIQWFYIQHGRCVCHIEVRGITQQDEGGDTWWRGYKQFGSSVSDTCTCK